MPAHVGKHDSRPAIRERQIVVEVTSRRLRGLAPAGDVEARQLRGTGGQQGLLNLARHPELPCHLLARRALLEKRLALQRDTSKRSERGAHLFVGSREPGAALVERFQNADRVGVVIQEWNTEERSCPEPAAAVDSRIEARVGARVRDVDDATHPVRRADDTTVDRDLDRPASRRQPAAKLTTSAIVEKDADSLAIEGAKRGLLEPRCSSVARSTPAVSWRVASMRPVRTWPAPSFRACLPDLVDHPDLQHS